MHAALPDAKALPHPLPPLPSRVNTLDQDCCILTTVTHFHLHLDMRAKVPS